jgi:sec-independent protein translocase protein TatB
MFDLAWSEIAIIGLVAVLVLGPKELPQAMRTMAKFARKMRNLSSELQGHMNEIVREAELEEVRQSIQKFSTTNIAAEVNKVVDPTGELASALGPEQQQVKPDQAALTEAAPQSEPAATVETAETQTPPPSAPGSSPAAS